MQGVWPNNALAVEAFAWAVRFEIVLEVSKWGGLGIQRANTHCNSSIIEHRYLCRPVGLASSRGIDEVRSASGRIVQLRIVSGFERSTLAASHRRAVTASPFLGVARRLLS
jgi:hypothetical protein